MMSNLPFPSRTQERRWFLALQKARANRAHAAERRLRSTISKTYQPLVSKVATLCAKDREGASLGDYERKGMRGLDRAIASYDPNKSYRFPTYAIWWIRKTIKGNG